MATLIADRFLVSCASESNAASDAVAALDLATGARVRLRIDAAGTRAEQQSWTEACTREHAEGALLDFGFIGSTHRFEARAHARGPRQPALSRRRRPASSNGSSTRARPRRGFSIVADFPDARVLRQRGFVPCDLALLDDAARSRRCVCRTRSPFGCRAGLARRAVERGAGVVASPPAWCAGVLRARAARSIEENSRHERSGRTSRVRWTSAGRRSPHGPDRWSRSSGCWREGAMRQPSEHCEAAIAAFERRGDFRRAGDAALRLGRLLLGRGRAADASALFTERTRSVSARPRRRSMRSRRRCISALHRPTWRN